MTASPGGGLLRSEAEAALRRAEAALAAAPGAIEPGFERARLLTLLGRDDDAKAAYLELLARAPAHIGALNNLGALLYAGGYRRAAKTAYAEAVRCRPDHPMGHVNLANLLGEEGAWPAARDHYHAALQVEPALGEAHRGLARACDELGEPAAADHHRRLGFRDQPITALPYRGTGRPVDVLLLVAANGGNVPLRHLLDDLTFRVFAVFAEFCDRTMVLPPHDLVVNAIGDADRCAPALAAAAQLTAASPAPVVNALAAVGRSGRAAIARHLAGVPGLRVPRIAAYRRKALSGETLARQGWRFPLLLRAPGFHTGRHFVQVESGAAVAEAVAALPGDEILAIEYLDARGADGLTRKYRVMVIDGRLYPLHLAISPEWKVHYFTAAMADPLHRAADAAFITDIAAVLDRSQIAVLQEIGQRLGLDYGGIDFSIGSDGQVLLFEANATMVVNPPDPGDIWQYRGAATARIHAAVRAMLMARAGRLT